MNQNVQRSGLHGGKPPSARLDAMRQRNAGIDGIKRLLSPDCVRP